MTDPYTNSIHMINGQAITLEEMRDVAIELRKLKFDYDSQNKKLDAVKDRLRKNIDESKDLHQRTGLYTYRGSAKAYSNILHYMSILDI